MLTDRYLPVNVLISLLNDLISKKYLMQTRHEAARVRLLFQSVGFYSAFLHFKAKPQKRSCNLNFSAQMKTSFFSYFIP